MVGRELFKLSPGLLSRFEQVVGFRNGNWIYLENLGLPVLNKFPESLFQSQVKPATTSYMGAVLG
jgi:hypothetical protein